MNQSIELVTDQDWPLVKTLVTSSLHELEFYKNLEPDAERRKCFLWDYVEVEYHGVNNLFWCGKVTKDVAATSKTFCPDSSSNNANLRSLFFVGMLIAPQGAAFNKIGTNIVDISTRQNARALLIKSDKHSTLTQEDPSLNSKYPKIMKNLQNFQLWYKSYTDKICKYAGKGFWQCCHIAVSPEFRQAGMAVAGMKEGIRAFSALADESGSHLVLVNTGVTKCHFVCKKAGYCDVITLKYKEKPRWIMTYLMNGNEVENEEAALQVRKTLNENF